MRNLQFAEERKVDHKKRSKPPLVLRWGGNSSCEELKEKFRTALCHVTLSRYRTENNESRVVSQREQSRPSPAGTRLQPPQTAEGSSGLLEELQSSPEVSSSHFTLLTSLEKRFSLLSATTQKSPDGFVFQRCFLSQTVPACFC